MNLQSKLSKKGKALKTLSWPEVLKGLKEGKMFKRRDWNSVDIINAVKGEIWIFGSKNWMPIMDDFISNDWIEVK